MKKVKKETCISVLKDAFGYYPSFVNRSEAIDVASLSTADYNDLSKYIDETIGVTAGGKSLKSLLNGAGPKNSTINILCAFLLVKKNLMTLSELKFETTISDNRYYVRRYFETNSAEENSSQIAKTEAELTPDKQPRSTKLYRYGFAALSIGILLTIGVWQFSQKSSNFPDIRVSMTNDSDQYPKVINVAYDLKSEKYLKNTRISFMTTPILLNELKGTVTLTAPHPGLFPIKLYSNDNVYGVQQVLLNSGGWRGSTDNNKRPLQKSEFVLDDVLHLKNADNVQKLPNGDYYTCFNIFRNFNMSGDNFTLEADIKNPPNEGSPWAHDISVDIIGFERPITFNFLSPDAIKYANLVVGNTDFKIGNKQPILQKLGVLFPKWKHLTVSCHNRKITILLDETTIINETYEGEIGQIIGLQFSFKGSGYMKNVLLNGKAV